MINGFTRLVLGVYGYWISNYVMLHLFPLLSPSALSSSHLSPSTLSSSHLFPSTLSSLLSPSTLSSFSIALTKLDIFDTFDELKIGVGYKLDGKVLESMPGSILLRQCQQCKGRLWACIDGLDSKFQHCILVCMRERLL